MTKLLLKRPIALLLAGAACVFMILPFRTLVAETLSGKVGRVLDDRSTEGMDTVGISNETLPQYQQAIDLLRSAASWDPGKAEYPKALSELYGRLGTWAEVMEGMGEKLPEAALTGRDAQQRSEVFLKRAIALEPSNPDYHFAMGQVQAGKHASLKVDELEKAVQLYPINSPLRYAVAMQYLNLGEKVKALEQARILAANDDSYRQTKTIETQTMQKRRNEGYIAFLVNNYLSRALEIAWKATDRDIEAIKRTIPDNSDAREVARMFYELKGIEE